MQKQTKLTESQVKLKKYLKPLVIEIKHEINESVDTIIYKTINMIKTQIGLELKLDNHFSGLQKHKGKPYFNVVFPQRTSESDEYSRFTKWHESCGNISIINLIEFLYLSIIFNIILNDVRIPLPPQP